MLIDVSYLAFRRRLDLAEASARKIEVNLSGLTGSHLERMEDIDGLLELRDVEDPMLRGGVDSYFIHPHTDGWHRLPVVGHQPRLHATKLIARQSAGLSWESAQVVECCAGFPLTLELTGPGLPKRCWVKISQIRTLSGERIGKRLAKIAPEELALVVEGLNARSVGTWRSRSRDV